MVRCLRNARLLAAIVIACPMLLMGCAELKDNGREWRDMQSERTLRGEPRWLDE